MTAPYPASSEIPDSVHDLDRVTRPQRLVDPTPVVVKNTEYGIGAS
ncbi:hypothetical protein HNR02_001973 [Amycolatopsis endophytica]|uniref:Uncharacterized protein n=1 Tax=Amycolatopsis endophytica TaxID=860233 RepID=A0A853B0X2_9PSEU|nr:hypothetical protein [Amycolatopsis endophytica]